MSNCVVGSGGSRLPRGIIAEHGVEGSDHFSHDGDDDDLGFFVGVGEAIVTSYNPGSAVPRRGEGPPNKSPARGAGLVGRHDTHLGFADLEVPSIRQQAYQLNAKPRSWFHASNSARAASDNRTTMQDLRRRNRARARRAAKVGRCRHKPG